MKKWIAVTICALLALLTFQLLHYPNLAGISKLVASTGFVAFALSSGAAKSRYGKTMLAGFVFSWFGDAFLIGSSDTFFQLGLVSFLLGHILYAAAFLHHGVKWKWSLLTLLALVPIAGFILSWLMPNVPEELRIPVLAYILVISSMVVLAVGTKGKGGVWAIPIGALLFYASDISVATNQFMAPDFPHYVWGLPAYYIAQLFLASSTAHPEGYSG